MGIIKLLHNRALEYADLALIAKHKGETDNSIDLYQNAYLLEKRAAELAKKGKIGNPTEQVLADSAAALKSMIEDYSAGKTANN